MTNAVLYLYWFAPACSQCKVWRHTRRLSRRSRMAVAVTRQLFLDEAGIASVKRGKLKRECLRSRCLNFTLKPREHILNSSYIIIF